MRPIEESNALFLDYWVATKSVVRVAMQYTRSDILPVISEERIAYHADAGIEDWLSNIRKMADTAGDNLRAYIESLRRQLEQQAERKAQTVITAAAAEGARHTKKWIATVSAGANIDVGLLVRDDDLTDLLALKAQETVSLIKSLSNDMADRIEQLALGSILEGRSNAETAKLLSEIEGIGIRRARLIARDQASKLNGAMNEFRQRQAEITHYVWRTVIDGRERPSHGANNGKTFEWDSPPSTGHPGHEINCRCRASAIIIDDEASAAQLAEEADFDADDLISTNEPLLRKVGGTISQPVTNWSRDALLIRQVETKEVQAIVAALRKNQKVIEADAERLYAMVYDADPEDIDAGMFTTRRTELFKAINARLAIVAELLSHVLEY